MHLGVVYREETDEVLMLQDKYNYKVNMHHIYLITSYI